MTVKEYAEVAYGEWYDFVDEPAAKRAHAANVERCRAALVYHARKDRLLDVLVIHGSGRSSFKSCAHELSNSQMLLRGALEGFRDGVKVTEIRLRDYAISPCNNCYSTTSALCGFPCNCFPLDPMQELYPLVLKADVMLCSTGVNQSAMSSRLKLYADRLISLDGGFLVDADQYKMKDSSWRDATIKLSTSLAAQGRLPYDARMWGRVAAYFITSKDEDNTRRTITRSEESPLSYVEAVAWSLRDGFADYGFFHADPWYAGAAARPGEELAYDKRHYNQEKFRREAAKVVAAAIELGEKYRRHPPAFDGGARVNRT